MLLDRNEKKGDFIILALNLGDEVEEHTVLADAGLKFKQLDGMYNGEKERSYLVPFVSADEFSVILNLARSYDQESILVSDEYRECQLLFLNTNKVEYLGELTAVSESEARRESAYTFDPVSGTYWICKR